MQDTGSQRPYFIANDTRGNAGVLSLGTVGSAGAIKLTLPSIAFSSAYSCVGYKDGTVGTFETHNRFWAGSYDPDSLLGESGTNKWWRHIGTDGWVTHARKNGGALSDIALPLPLSIVHGTGVEISEPIHLLNRNSSDRAIDGPAFAFAFTTNTETADERDRFEAWIAHRAGIASSLVGSHPYRDAPPTV